MLKRVLLTIVTVSLGLFAGAALAVLGHMQTEAVESPQVVSQSLPESTSQSVAGIEAQNLPQEEDGYYIKEYKGRISVMKGDNEVPEMVFDISTKMLPDVDKQVLQEGIYVASYEELVKVLEDYIS